MNMLANHFKEKGWIVMYLSAQSWVSGIEPFAWTADGSYKQPELAARILKDFWEANSSILSKLQVQKKPVSQLVKEQKPENVHATLESVINGLLKDNSRPPMLICIDQVNALYSTTAYHDKESNVLDADRFKLPAYFRKLIGSNADRASILLSSDDSQPLLKSASLRTKISSLPAINPDLLAGQEPQAKYASKDLKAERLLISPYNMEEVKQTLDYFQTVHLVQKEIQPRDVAKQFMMCQGNPHELLKMAERADI